MRAVQPDSQRRVWRWRRRRRKGAGRWSRRGTASIRMTYSADEARVVPTVAQGLQEPIPRINLEVTAMAFGAKHLLIV